MEHFWRKISFLILFLLLSVNGMEETSTTQSNGMAASSPKRSLSTPTISIEVVGQPYLIEKVKVKLNLFGALTVLKQQLRERVQQNMKPSEPVKENPGGEITTGPEPPPQKFRPKWFYSGSKQYKVILVNYLNKHGTPHDCKNLLTEFSQLPPYNSEFTNDDFNRILRLFEESTPGSCVTYKDTLNKTLAEMTESMKEKTKELKAVKDKGDRNERLGKYRGHLVGSFQSAIILAEGLIIKDLETGPFLETAVTFFEKLLLNSHYLSDSEKDSTLSHVLEVNRLFANSQTRIYDKMVPDKRRILIPLRKKNPKGKLPMTVEHFVNVQPLVVLINTGSGDNKGPKLLREFRSILDPIQVFNIMEGGPEMGLEMFRDVPGLRVLACGGDGTVGWVLSALDRMYPETPHATNKVPPPVGVLPLGTGNDLARVLGWGGGYTEPIAGSISGSIKRILANLMKSTPVKMDRWKLNVVPNSHVHGDGKGSATLPNAEPNSLVPASATLPANVANNYFSLGLDAEVCWEFDIARKKNPKTFSTRWGNKLYYAARSLKSMGEGKWKNLPDVMELECDDIDITGTLKEHAVQALLFLNIPSYGGGTHPWGGAAASMEDRLIEVVGLTWNQMLFLQTNGRGTSIRQCRTVKITTKATIPMQVDGEPIKMKPSIITLGALKEQATMLHKKTVNAMRRASDRASDRASVRTQIVV